MQRPWQAVTADPACDLLVSPASIWELAIKVGLGKLTLSQPYRSWMDQALADLGAFLLPITVDYAAQSALPDHHRDPFDRLMIAQALVEGVPILSGDSQFDLYGVERPWASSPADLMPGQIKYNPLMLIIF